MIQQDKPGGRFPWTAEQWDQAWDDIERGNPGPQLIFPIIIISDASPITSKVKYRAGDGRSGVGRPRGTHEQHGGCKCGEAHI